ncbi:MAG: CBU_0592 family membrane protein [Candidatus Zixiibacteriota bacterium]
MEQVLSIGAAITILAAYAGLQLGYLDNKRPLFNWVNLIGAIILCIVAFRAAQWGFVILEATWGIISLWPLFRLKKAGS